MKTIQEASEVGVGDLIPAEELQRLTATPEELFDKKRNELLVSLMSSMVGVATQNGSHAYVARMTADYDTKVLDSAKEALADLGYNVSYEPSKFVVEGREIDIILFKISWEVQ